MQFKTILKEIKHYIPSKKYIKKMKLLKYKAKYVQALSSSRCKACLWSEYPLGLTMV
jgi:hypothetical protein